MDAPELPGFRTEEVAIGSATMVSLHGELDILYESHVTAGFVHQTQVATQVVRKRTELPVADPEKTAEPDGQAAN